MFNRLERGVMGTVEELVSSLEADPLLLGHTVFTTHFPLKTPYFHTKLMDEANKQRYLAVAAPRESAKSTLLVFVYPFHQVLFKKRRFILIISNTFTKAAMHLSNMKKELADNETLLSMFPGIQIVKDAEGDSNFRHPDGFETKILCRGVDQIPSVRGVKFGAYRPDLIIGDDMEDDELVLSPDRRRKLKEDFDTALLPAGDRQNCKYIFVGTILHDDSQLARLVSEEQYTEYKKLFFAAHLNPKKKNEDSLWEEKWSVEWLNQLSKEKPNVYAKEMQNDPVAGQNVRFLKQDFRYWKIQEGDYVLMDENGEPFSRNRLDTCKAAISCDLAWKEKRDADASVILPGLLTQNSEILLLDYTNEKGMRPNILAEILFSLVDRLQRMTKSNVPIGFEKAMLENVTQWLLRREMHQRNKYLYTKELVWDADKNTRIETRLQPRYNQHVIFHTRQMGDLEHQLLRFPFGAQDDLIDAEQGLVQLLQFPKDKTAETKKEDQFMWWRKKAIEQFTPHKRKIGRMRDKRRFTLPAQESWR